MKRIFLGLSFVAAIGSAFTTKSESYAGELYIKQNNQCTTVVCRTSGSQPCADQTTPLYNSSCQLYQGVRFKP